MTRLVNTEDMRALGARIGREAAKNVAARIKPATFRAPPAPLKFKGNVPIASDLTADEAKALGARIDLVGSYANNVEHYATQGTSLYDFALDQFINGEEVEPATDALMSALRKQSAEFSSARMRAR
jgi:hypothetical protein